MKKILLPLVVLFSGCLIYEQPTYPTLDGEYILESMKIIEEDIFNRGETNLKIDLSETYPNPIGPLDTLKVFKTRIHISGPQLLVSPYVFMGDEEWGDTLYFVVEQDISDRSEWNRMNIEYLGTVRKYKIIEDSIDSFALRSTEAYDLSDGKRYIFFLYFERIGP